MSRIDLFHLDDADLTYSDAMKNYLNDAGDVALVPQESEIISFRRHLPHHARFAGRHLAYNRREDGIFSVGDSLDFEIRIEQPFGDIARRFAEWSFGLKELSRDFTFDNDLGISRNHHIVREALDNFNRRTGESARDVKFTHAKRYAGWRCVRYRWRCSDDQCSLKGNPSLLALAPMITSVIARTEKDTRSRWAFYLTTVVADVDETSLRIFGKPVRRRRKRRAIVARCRDRNRKFAQAAFVHQRRSPMDFFMDRSIINDPRWDRIALGLVPPIDNFLGFALEPEAIYVSRSSQSSYHHSNIVLPPLDVRDIREHERPPFVLRQAAKLPPHQRHQFCVLVDLFVDFDQQACFVQCRDVFSEILEVTHDYPLRLLKLRREMADEIPQNSRHIDATTDHFDRLRGHKGSPKTSSNVNRRPFSSCRRPCRTSFIIVRLRMISLVSRHPSYSSALMRTAAGRPLRVMTSSSSSFSQPATSRLRWVLAFDRLRKRTITISP